MSTAELPTWAMIAADARRVRERLAGELRTWGALFHAHRRGPGMPGYWHAAHVASVQPVRERLLAGDLTASDRDRAEAAADDLWDAVAAGWAFAGWLRGQHLDEAPAVEHVTAELIFAGRWLARYPVTIAAHEAAVAELFAVAEEAAG